MAVAPTGAIYKALEFDGVSSRTYGVYITGAAVYNAPERDVEMIAIPGRNGSFALDKGRFENIEVSYPAGIFADAESDFAEAVSDFRNFLCSRNGYVRLQDEYNPNEYRMAVYKSGLEVEPSLLRAGEFEIVFECKPQRWLTSGESAVTVGEWSDWETESGPIVEIEASETDKVKSLSVSLDPIQDLHGYDKPWAGGAGKNKFNGADVTTSNSSNWGIDWNESTNTLTITHKTEYSTGAPLLPLDLEAGTYVVSFASQTKTASISLYTNGAYTDILRSGTTFSVESGNSYEVRFTADEGTPNVITSIQIESGTTASAFNPYSNICPISGRTSVDTIVSPTTDAEDGTTYTTTLGQTVYGGTLDVVSGELVVDRAMVTFSDSARWSVTETSGHYRAYTYALTDILPWNDNRHATTTMICDRLSTGSWEDVFVGTAVLGQTNKAIGFGTDSLGITDGTSLGAWLANNPLTICYELAQPQTYQLTPTEVALLKGQNNVWSDGDVTLEYGQDPNVIVNPTLFEASPLLIAEGTGKITVNGTDIRIQNSVVGDCGLCYDLNVPGNYYLAGFTNIYIATGDIIETESINYAFAIYNAYSSYTFTSQSITNVTGNPDVLPDATDLPGGEAVVVTCRLDDEAYSFGTALSKTIGFDVNVTNSNGDSATIHVEVTAAYDGNKIIEYSAFVGYVPEAFYLYNPMFQFTAAPSITIHSTAATFGNPTYIDCDIGEAYADLGGTISPLNRYIELGSKLPTLAIGNTEITFDNTIATLKVVPRWWKI